MKHSYTSFNPQSGMAPLMIGIVVGALVLIAGTGYYFMQRMDSRGMPQTSRTGMTAPGSGTSESIPADTSTAGDSLANVTTTIDGLIGRGQNLECDWQPPAVAAGAVSGVGKLYTTGSMGRSMITTELPGGISMQADALYKNGDLHTWTNINGTKTGFKMTAAEQQAMAGDMTAEQRAQAEQIRQEMVFNCVPWTPDMSMFEVPADVTFSSMAR